MFGLERNRGENESGDGGHLPLQSNFAADAVLRRFAWLPSRLRFSARLVVHGADALAIVTEWQEFREPDFARIKKLMRAPVIFDGRNIYQPDQMKALGFTYTSIGR